MHIAAVTSSAGSSWQSCESLFQDLGKVGLPGDVDRIVLCDREVEMPGCSWSILVPVTTDYTDLPSVGSNQETIDSFQKIFAFILPYDRVIYFDHDLVIPDDTRLLWSDSIGNLPLYASQTPDNGLNDDLMVFHPNQTPGFHDSLLYYSRVHRPKILPGSCRATIEWYMHLTKKEIGPLPLKSNPTKRTGGR